MLNIEKGLVLEKITSSGRYATLIVGNISEENNVSFVELPGLNPRNNKIDLSQWGDYCVYTRGISEFKNSIESGEYGVLEKKSFDNLFEHFNLLMDNPIPNGLVFDEKKYPSNFKIMIENQNINELYRK